MAKKVAVFLKGWDAGIVLYAKNWKLSYFNQTRYKMLQILHEEFSAELKKKVAEVCETLNIASDHMIQKGDTNQSWDIDQIRKNMKNLLHNTEDDQI